MAARLSLRVLMLLTFIALGFGVASVLHSFGLPTFGG
jgi:hypothetical protein